MTTPFGRPLRHVKKSIVLRLENIYDGEDFIRAYVVPLVYSMNALLSVLKGSSLISGSSETSEEVEKSSPIITTFLTL